jgi:peptide deformylase
MKLKIISQPNPLLSEKSKKITRIDDSIKKLAQDMADTLVGYGDEHESGVAIAAVQVGVPIRMTVIKEEDGYFALLNPEVVKGSKEYEEDMEGCMSVPKKYGRVKRFKKVKVRGIDLEGRKVEIKAEGLLARILQHEIDHMDGKVFTCHVENNEVYTLNHEGKLVK